MAKIADFGVSRLLDQGEQAMTMVGSLVYTAPEILMEKPYNHQCDMWSLGVLIYQMMTLQTPKGIMNLVNNGGNIKINFGKAPLKLL